MTDVPKVLEDLRGAIASVNARLPGSRFDVQLLPQSGRGCLARFMVQHNHSNGINISRTQVAIGGQITAKHPRFAWQLEGDNWRELLAKIVGEDAGWIEGRRRRR
jgi:hypothetical protein